MSGGGRCADKHIAATVASLLWCPRSTVHRAHERGRIVLTTETQQSTTTTMLQGRGMRQCNWLVRRWHAAAIDDILRDVAAVAVAGDLTDSVVPRILF